MASHVPAGDGSEAAELILDVRDLVTHFRTPGGLVKAVDGVSLSVGRGRTLGVVGESGSGKTVLTRSIMGLLPRDNVVRSGHVWLAGRDLMALDRRALRDIWGAEIGMIFQDPMTSLNPVRKIGPQIISPLRRHLGLGRQEGRRVAGDLLRSVGLADPVRRLDEYPHQLSGGMRQRVMIAIALACGPGLLLADEPTTALDVTVQKQILSLLAAQQAERAMAMMLVTHDLGVVAAYSDEVAVMYAGRVVERAPTRSLFSNMRMPYTEALFQSIPRLAEASHTPPRVVSGRPPDLARLLPGCSFAPRCLYVQDRCRREAPKLEPLATDGSHHVACWYPLELSKGGRPGQPRVDASPAGETVVGVHMGGGR